MKVGRAHTFALLIAGLLGLCAGAGPAQAQQQQRAPAEIFKDDAVLARAVGSILNMDLAELASFADYIAACVDNLNQSEVLQHDCKKARARFRVEFGQGRDLDRLIAILDLTQSIGRGNDRSGTRTDESMAMTVRGVEVERRFEEAANLRFRELRTQAARR